MDAPRELKVSITAQVNERLAAKFGQEPGAYTTTAKVRLRPLEELLVVKGLVTEAELSSMYSAAINDGQRLSYHY